MGFREVIFPVRHDRSYGLASACFLVIVVIAEIEGLVLFALGVVVHRADLFPELQFAIAPAAFFVAVVSAIALAIEQRRVATRIKTYTDVRSTNDVGAYADLVANRRRDR